MWGLYDLGFMIPNLDGKCNRENLHYSITLLHYTHNNIHLKVREASMKSSMRNEIKAYIVRQGMTMQEVVDVLSDVYGWSDSVSNLSNKLQRESLRYKEAVQLADALGYDIQWVKRKEDR